MITVKIMLIKLTCHGASISCYYIHLFPISSTLAFLMRKVADVGKYSARQTRYSVMTHMHVQIDTIF